MYFIYRVRKHSENDKNCLDSKKGKGKSRKTAAANDLMMVTGLLCGIFGVQTIAGTTLCNSKLKNFEGVDISYDSVQEISTHPFGHAKYKAMLVFMADEIMTKISQGDQSFRYLF